LGVRLGVS